MKKSGELMFGQVPALQVKTGGDVTVLNQSAAILRFVAKLAPERGLYPQDAVLAAKVDALCDQEADAFAGMRVCKYKERFGFGFLNDAANAELCASRRVRTRARSLFRSYARVTIPFLLPYSKREEASGRLAGATVAMNAEIIPGHLARLAASAPRPPPCVSPLCRRTAACDALEK